jgi:hypothetical protein
MRIICIVDAAWGIRYLVAMRHGFWRSLSAVVSGTAFVVAVAGPVQWDPCPTHGAGPHVQGAAMQMPTGAEMPADAVDLASSPRVVLPFALLDVRYREVESGAQVNPGEGRAIYANMRFRVP